MFRIRDFKYSFIWFYVFGLTSFIPSNRSRDKVFLIISIVPKALYAFIVIISATYYLKHHQWQTLKSHTTTILFFTIAKILPDIFSVVFQLRTPFATQSICKMFVNCFQLLNDQLGIKADSNNFSKKYHNKIVFNLFFQLTICLIKFIIDPTHDSIEMSIFFTFAQIYHIFIVLHITLFIDLMQYFLFTINTNMNYVVQNRKGKLKLIEIVDSIKMLHLHLQNISSLINSYFGLILIVVLLHDLAFSTFEIYGIFMHMKTIEQIREFKFICNHIFSEMVVSKPI